MAREGVALSAMARVLKQVAHASALRLPVELVDDAALEAWARWLAAGGEAGEERQRADPSAYLVGIFHHVCADAVRAHRRRQRWCALAADLGVEPAELVDERPARGLGGGIARLLEQVVRPVFADLPSADVELWIAAKVEGLGWQAAGEAAGRDLAAIARVRRTISGVLSPEGVLGLLAQRMDILPHAPTGRSQPPSHAAMRRAQSSRLRAATGRRIGSPNRCWRRSRRSLRPRARPCRSSIRRLRTR